MKIFSEDISGIKKELDNLVKELHHPHNSIETRNILLSLEALAYFYNYIEYDDNYYLKAAHSNEKIVEALNHEEIKIRNKIINDFINDKNDYLDLFDNIYSDNTEVSFNNSYNAYEPNLDEKEMYEILNDFFRSVGNKALQNRFKNLIDAKKIALIYLQPGTGGLTLYNLMSNDSRIFIDEETSEDSIRTMITLSHEMGHVVDYSQINSQKDKSYYSSKSIFVEVISSLYEKKFIDFLIKNNVYKPYSTTCLSEFYEDIFIDAEKSSIYHAIPNDLLKNEIYIELSKEQLIEEISKEHDVLVSTDEFPEPNELDICEDLAYGCGKILGTYFSRLEKEDKRKYQDEMSKFLNLRTDYFDKNYLEKMGTNTKKVIELVDRDINLSSAKVKVKRI